MHYLILDTCVWRDLVETEYSLIDKLSQLIEDEKVTIIVPETVRDEWDIGKKYSTEKIIKEITAARQSAINLLNFCDQTEGSESNDFIKSIDPQSLGKTIANERIQAIEKILDSKNTIRLPLTDQVHTVVINHGLSKKAPFRLKNSMADALIFFTAVEWVNTHKPDSSVFVTHNTKDFSDNKQGEEDKTYHKRLAPDLQPHVETNGLKYGVIVSQILNEIETSIATEEEIEREEAVVERIRMKDDVIEYLVTGGTIGKVLEEQKKLRESITGGTIGKVLEEQKKLRESITGGTIGKVLEEQKKLRESITGVTIGKVLEEQKKLRESITGGTIGKVLEEQKKLRALISGGALGSVLKEQEKLRKLVKHKQITDEDSRSDNRND